MAIVVPVQAGGRTLPYRTIPVMSYDIGPGRRARVECHHGTSRPRLVRGWPNKGITTGLRSPAAHTNNTLVNSHKDR